MKNGILKAVLGIVILLCLYGVSFSHFAVILPLDDIVNGKPLPFCRVEVEYFNEGKKVKVPKSPYITQVIKTDANGVFAYSFPKGGWWGFSAITDAPYKLKKDGKEYPVELGGIMWVKVREMR